MRKCLYALFGQFGKVIDVVSQKTQNLRGQAWIVFADVSSATNALRAMQDFPFFGKPLVSFANSILIISLINGLAPVFTKL